MGGKADGDAGVIVIGPGRMGLGIALAFALARLPVRIVDVKERNDKERERMIARSREELTSTIKLLRRVKYSSLRPASVLSSVTFCSGITRENLAGDYIFEALPEKPELKIKLFRDISPLISRKAIVASATSTIDIKTMARGLSNPERLLITHWLNPAFIIPLVEIARADMTATGTVRSMSRLLKSIGKVPVVLKDSPGFIIPRIQAGAMNEAVRILEEGIASAEDIDIAIRYGFGFRLSVLGLLEFIDLGGLDILYYADRFLYSAYKAERFKAPKLIEDKMKRGETGPRAGKGIYEYRDRDTKSLFEKKYRDLIRVLKAIR
ncbi:MAG TPA: 3-hydroxyacyl-CoA dehydrogenase NAD-binding domain-containing protein [Syntrophorhabdales bacterium]|nr:3-hydroxyacyl-CoA dehydrogenase NAD-binding domain-containing protein [Syntrophorhabdales bacterium]